jgi:hypothetical protein
MTADQVIKLSNQFSVANLPLDVIWLDIDVSINELFNLTIACSKEVILYLGSLKI